MHEVKLISVEEIDGALHAAVDFREDGQPLTAPGRRDPIADAVAAALGTPAPASPQPSPLLGHKVVIPVAAIGSRMALYGLATAEEALEAILREHMTRLSSLPDPDSREELVSRMKGGDIGEISVKSGSSAAPVLQKAKAEIESARRARVG